MAFEYWTIWNPTSFWFSNTKLVWYSDPHCIEVHIMIRTDFENCLISALCSHYSYPFLRLDGSTSTVQRQQVVSRFNNPHCDDFVLLLSSKAGGTGTVFDRKMKIRPPCPDFGYRLSRMTIWTPEYIQIMAWLPNIGQSDILLTLFFIHFLFGVLYFQMYLF